MVQDGEGSMDMNLLLFVALAAVSAGALAYGLLFSRVQSEKNIERRFETVRNAEADRNVVRASRDRVAEAAKRRKSVQDTLKDLEEKQKARGAGPAQAAAEGADPAGGPHHDDRASSISSRPRPAS